MSDRSEPTEEQRRLADEWQVGLTDDEYSSLVFADAYARGMAHGADRARAEERAAIVALLGAVRDYIAECGPCPATDDFNGEMYCGTDTKCDYCRVAEAYWEVSERPPPPTPHHEAK